MKGNPISRKFQNGKLLIYARGKRLLQKGEKKRHLIGAMALRFAREDLCSFRFFFRKMNKEERREA